MGVPATRVKHLFAPAPADAAAQSGGLPPTEVPSQLLPGVVPLPAGDLAPLDRSEGSLPPSDVEPTAPFSTGKISQMGRRRRGRRPAPWRRLPFRTTRI
jgi:hypothetical protein